MYYPELSTIQEWPPLEPGKPEEPRSAIGWLDSDHEFTTGMAPSPFVAKLRTLCVNPKRCYKGFHTCPFCSANPVYQGNGKQLLLGAAEIEVHGHRAIYCAPALIIHYVEAHHYLPPQEFIDAVIALP